jgi:hypothetical protein
MLPDGDLQFALSIGVGPNIPHWGVYVKENQKGM